MTSDMMIPPPVMWAQRRNVVFLTFCVEDCKNPDLKISNDNIYFKGTGGPDQRAYENTIQLFKDIDVEKSRSFIRDRNIELLLVKKEEGPFWPHLLKQKLKVHWLKIDFGKWKDEDDSDDEAGAAAAGPGGGRDGGQLEEMMKQMGGLSGAGGDARPSLDDLSDEADSDDEELPDLE